MKELVDKDKKIKHFKEMINSLEISLKEVNDDIYRHQSQNPHLLEVAKKCIDEKAITNKSNLLKIEILEKNARKMGRISI